MGIYLNPGAQLLRMSRRSRIYVDKSGMIPFLNRVSNTEQRFVCVSQPRRFGKTMAANMVCAYYDRTVDGAREFAGIAAASDPWFDEYRNRYDVIRINMQQFLSAAHDMGSLLELLSKTLARDIMRTYDDLDFLAPDSLSFVMADSYAQTGTQFVIVIDEWDCPMREMQDQHDEQKRYLDFLRSWLKDQPYVALCYMTGILPIKKYGTHSALNMFSEYSMLAAYEMAPFVGFTEDEVRALCVQWGRDFDECRAWYDGYQIQGVDEQIIDTYGPRSVVRAMETGDFASFWNKTETYEALRHYVDLDMDGLHDRVVELIAGNRMPVNTGTYANDMTTLHSADDVLTLLVHLGYLAYDASTSEVFVPNREVMGEFANSVRNGGWDEVARSIRASEDLLDALVAGDAETVAAGVERAHEASQPDEPSRQACSYRSSTSAVDLA